MTAAGTEPPQYSAPILRWRAKHSWIEGRQLAFHGSAWGLFGLWWKWLLLSIVTFGIYLFWVAPRIYRWKWEHTSWAHQVPGTV